MQELTRYCFTVKYFDYYVKPIFEPIAIPFLTISTVSLCIVFLYLHSMMSYYSAKEALITLNIKTEETNNLEDLWTIFFTLVFVLFLPVFVVWYSQYTNTKINVLIPLVLLALNLFLLPHVYTWLTGNIFIVFLRGAAPSTSLVYEYVLDIINYVSFNLRMNLQFSRVVIILITGFTFFYYEMR